MPERKSGNARKKLIQKPLFKPEELNIKKPLQEHRIKPSTKKKLEQTQLFKEELGPTRDKGIRKNLNRHLQHRNLREEKGMKQDKKVLAQQITESMGKHVDIIPSIGGSLTLENYNPNDPLKQSIPQTDDASLTSQMIIQDPKEKKEIERFRKHARKKNSPNRYNGLVKKIKEKKFKREIRPEPANPKEQQSNLVKRQLDPEKFFKDNPKSISQNRAIVNQQIEEEIIGSKGADEAPITAIVITENKYKIGSWKRGNLPHFENMSLTSQKIEPDPEVERLRKLARQKNQPNKFKEPIRKLKKRKQK